MDPATILHADLDAFYASVEQLLDPSLRGLPVAVGGGVVLAASYEARASGVKGGMGGWRARQLCPELRFVGGHFREYQRLGDHVMDILRDFTPLVERVSIDEAFLDVSGSVHLFGPPADMAARIRARVREEVGLPISVGVARTKHLAKIASQVAKPDGLVVVAAGREDAFLAPLPVGLIWGVGPATRARLAGRDIHTIGQLAASSERSLQDLVGRAAGARLSALAHNVDPRAIQTSRRARSVGAQSALGRRRAEPELIRDTLGYLSDRVAGRLRAAGRAGRTVSVRVRFPGLRVVGRSVTLRQPVATTLTLTEVAAELVGAALSGNPEEGEISLLAVSVSQLVDEPPVQLAFDLDRLPVGPTVSERGAGPRRGPPGSGVVARSVGAAPRPVGLDEARRSLDASIDDLRTRFGRGALGYAATQLSRSRLVPEEFRELAEREL